MCSLACGCACGALLALAFVFALALARGCRRRSPALAVKTRLAEVLISRGPRARFAPAPPAVASERPLARRETSSLLGAPPPGPEETYKRVPKLPLPKHWLNKPFSKYSTDIPRPLAASNLKPEPEVKDKQFSVTRSPSLENDKSPFVVKGEVFMFNTGKDMSEDMPRDEDGGSNLRRYQSVSTRLNMCSETFDEKQNSPKECSSAKEKTNVSKFDFSPKLLVDSLTSPRYFTPPEMVSPAFFAEPSPRSVYYDTVRSPRFFAETPRPDGVISPLASPRTLLDHQNRNNGEKPGSPRVLSAKPKSPKVYSPKVYNKENYFTFDNVHIVEENASRLSPRPRRYLGRNSIEKERFTPPADKEIRKYKRHHSCDTSYKNIEINIPKTENNNVETETVHKEIDVVDCCAKMEAVNIETNSEIEKTELLNPCQSTAQMRRQRLKSISLDSDNAKIIEQNLGLPIAKQLKEQMNEAYKKQEVSTSCDIPTTPDERPAFKFDEDKTKSPEGDPKTPELLQKKSLRQSSDTQSFIDMPRFSPKEFEITVTSEEGATTAAEVHSKKKGKNLRNLTIDLTIRDSDLEKELLEFEKLYTDAEEKKVKTPTLKVKATSLDSSESVNLSLPQKKTLDVPQNSISVPNTPKRQLKRILAQKSSLKHDYSGSKLTERRLYMKGQDSGIFLRENHASLMLYQPGTSRMGSRTMGSFDEDMVDVPPEINISGAEQKYHEVQSLGSNLLNYKPNLSVSSTNLKTLPEGVPSDDFETSIEDEKFGKKLNRRNSNQSMMLSLDGKYSTHSLQSSNCSLSSSGTSCHNLASVRTSVSNFSLNTDNRQKKLSLERRDSNASMMVNVEHLTPTTRVICSSNTNLVGESSKNCLLQRRGSNNSLTLNITTNLSRHASNSSLNKDPKIGQKKGLLERRSSNTSLTLNINNSNPQLSVSRGLSISNYNLNGSTCNLSRYNSNQSIDNQTHEPKKGILERRSSNTSLTLNITQEPRELEIDETVLERTVKEPQHRKSLSTENLIPKSYKIKTAENKNFGSHDNLWSNSYQEPRNLTYVCGDQENEIIYALGTTEQTYPQQGFVRNITTKPLSPQSTSEDFRLYLANMQHLQNASSVLTRQQLRDLNNVFQNGYSKVKCLGSSDAQPCCSGFVDLGGSSSSELQPCSEYQKILLRNLHQEFWDMPTNFQEKAIVSGASLKNRYRSILPNEHSRVILERGAAAPEGYINANFIKGHEYTRNSYVATQGPLQNTTYDFWRMVHQNHDAARPRTQVDRTRTEAERTRVEGERTRVEVERTKLESEMTRTESVRTGFDTQITRLESDKTRLESNKTRLEADNKDEAENARLESERTRLQSDRQVPLSLKIEPVWTEAESGRSSQCWDRTKTEPHRTGPEADCTRTEPEMIALNLDRTKTESEHEGVQKVVMLTNFIENNRQKCEKYFPLELNEELTFYNTDAPDTNFFSEITESEKSRYVIKNCGVLQKPGYTIRKLKVTHIPSDSESESVYIYHYWFNNWADHKCPKDVNALLNLSLDVLKDTRYDFSNKEEQVDTKCKCGDSPKEARFVFPSDSKNSLCESETALSTCLDFSAESKSPPIIIHCSAGIGRTGCLIAILNGIKQLSSDQKVDILGIVCNMRLNRGGMVQSSEQYELVHKVLCLFEEACLPKME